MWEKKLKTLLSILAPEVKWENNHHCLMRTLEIKNKSIVIGKFETKRVLNNKNFEPKICELTIYVVYAEYVFFSFVLLQRN